MVMMGGGGGGGGESGLGGIHLAVGCCGVWVPRTRIFVITNVHSTDNHRGSLDPLTSCVEKDTSSTSADIQQSAYAIAALHILPVTNRYSPFTHGIAFRIIRS